MINKYKLISEAWQKKYVLMCEMSDFLSSKLNKKRKHFSITLVYAILVTIILIIKFIIK